MLTDDDLTVLLRRRFAQATADLDPTPDLVHVVRRRYVRTRRRRIVAAVAVPAVALAAGSAFALAGRGLPNHTPSHTAVPARSHAAPRTTPPTSVRTKPVSYTVARNNRSTPSNCPANAKAPVSKTANPRPGVWFWTNGQCFFVGIGGADTKPGDATALQIESFPGLYGTLKDGVRSIYAPGIGGRGWWVLTMPASTPLDTAVRMLVPAN
jgi:hypothetical protein